MQAATPRRCELRSDAGSENVVGQAVESWLPEEGFATYPLTVFLQACMEGFQVVTMESVVGEVDIFSSTTGNFSIITLEMMGELDVMSLWVSGGLGEAQRREVPWPPGCPRASRWRWQKVLGVMASPLASPSIGPTRRTWS